MGGVEADVRRVIRRFFPEAYIRRVEDSRYVGYYVYPGRNFVYDEAKRLEAFLPPGSRVFPNPRLHVIFIHVKKRGEPEGPAVYVF